MKKLILVTVITVIDSSLARGQAVYDFAQGKFTNIGYVKEGVTASLRIDNINTLFIRSQ